MIISKTLLGEEISEEEADYADICSQSFTTTWSFEELEEWLATAALDTATEEKIRTVIDQLKEHKS